MEVHTYRDNLLMPMCPQSTNSKCMVRLEHNAVVKLKKSSIDSKKMDIKPDYQVLQPANLLFVLEQVSAAPGGNEGAC